METDELDVNVSQLSAFLGISGVSFIESELPPIDSELFVRNIPDRLLSPSSELPSVATSAPLDVAFLSGRCPEDFLGRPVRCAALTLQKTPALWHRTHGSPSCGRVHRSF